MDDIMDMPSPFAQQPPKLPPEFDKLRHMDTFSEAMFNRIIAIQEREHKAWDESANFAERIKDIPLHALVFSNPDRDPQTHAATIAPFYPLSGELQQIAHVIKQLGDEAGVCDLHPGNGFIGSLLAQQGVRVIGAKGQAAKPHQIEQFYDSDCYQWQDSETALMTADVVFSAWMPSGQNMTPIIISHRPKLIIFIHTDHNDESTGLAQTGTTEAYTDLPAHYKQILEWSIERPEDIFHAIWPDLTPSIAETRHVRIYADESWQNIDLGDELPAPEPYDWEKDLDMALTAYQAKLMLREQGFPV